MTSARSTPRAFTASKASRAALSSLMGVLEAPHFQSAGETRKYAPYTGAKASRRHSGGRTIRCANLYWRRRGCRRGRGHPDHFSP